MPTRTFLETPHSDEEAVLPGPPPPIAETIVDLANGPVRATDVARLSDLDRHEARVLGEAWPLLPEAHRISILREMELLAEGRLELTFGRALRIAVEDDSATVRQLAVAGLWEDERDDLLAMLLGLVESDPSQDVRAEAARTLGPYADRAAAGDLDEDAHVAIFGLLTSVAEDELTPYGVRRKALESVGVFGREPAVMELIEDAYDSDDQGMRASAIYAMGRSLDPRWFGTILDELPSPEAELRYEAARAAGAFGDDRAVPDLSLLAEDLDMEVRQAAIAALGAIGGRSAVQVLRRLAEASEAGDTELIDAALEEAAIVQELVRPGPGPA